jgi:2-polyprenyl-3-methyl-5-hydroxy-6-metoxy-1,4-benzoquinol methylase
MTAKEHYENHLGHVYSWMMGNFKEKSNEFKSFLYEQAIVPVSNKIAVDLGTGHGIQSVALAAMGFRVLAIDFSQTLLDELERNAAAFDITALNEDIKNFKNFVDHPELIVCCGDTLSHLENKSEIKTLIADIAESLASNGKLILSFRDYSVELQGTDRFVPVRSEQDRILTCILNYDQEFVNVTDLLHERTKGAWTQEVSTYRKVRLIADEIAGDLKANGMKINFNQPVNRLTTIIATKEQCIK